MEDRDKTIDCSKPIRFIDEGSKVRKNFTQSYFYREIGRYKNASPSEFQWAAEDKLISKNSYEEVKCQLPDSPRSTFLMVFSPDGKKVASTHGNHNVYVTDLTTGKNIQTLSGHPRTPWCIAFHPSSNQILASGCLGGQVRVWDLHGGSEVWTAESQTVIASLAFHPVGRMLVIATYNELHFWDWSQPEPFAKCSTKSEREKVRYVSFDRLGNKLITGIANPVNVPSQWDRINVLSSQPPSTSTPASTTTFSSSVSTTSSNSQSSSDQGRSITFCYRHLMNQYNQLMDRYFDLSQSRVTPTTDRGTDPMDLLDLRNNASTSGISSSAVSSSVSTSQANSPSPLRFKFTRSPSRNYRPLNNRKRFRIHSSIFSRLNNRSSLPGHGSLAFSTTSSIPSNQNLALTTTTSVGSTSSSTQSPSRLRRCAFSFGPTTRSWSLTFSPENSSNVLFTRNSSQTNTSRAITNPTYSSYPERGIFSTRESSSNNSERSQFSVVWPCRVLLDESNNNQQGSSSAPQLNSTTESNRLRSVINRSSINSTNRISSNVTSAMTRTPSCSQNKIENESQTSPGLQFKRQRNHLQQGNFSKSGQERRSRDTDRTDKKFIRKNQKHISRFQVRSRLSQDHQSQLQLITNRETHGLNLQNNQNLRRQLSFRPGGQFVLSRHSNSPFQPQSFSHSSNPSLSNSLSSRIKSNLTSKQVPSFTASHSPNSNSAEEASTSSSEGAACSPTSNTNTLSLSGKRYYRQLREQVENRLFDSVKRLLRNRLRNSLDIPSVDSTVNYSQISGESEEGEHSPLHSLDSEDNNLSRGLGPRGTDPMLSSVSENREVSNELLLDSSSTLSTSTPNISLNSNGFSASQNGSEIFDTWDPEVETPPISLNSDLPVSDILIEEQSQINQPSTSSRNNLSDSDESDTDSNSASVTDSNVSSSPEFNVREGIQRISRGIENLQRFCWSRIETLQRQKIKRMWKELMNHITRFRDAIQSRGEEINAALLPNQNDNSNSSTELPSLRNLAISTPFSRELTSPTSSASLKFDIVNDYKKLVESMVNEIFDKAKKSKKASKKKSSSIFRSSVMKNENLGVITSTSSLNTSLTTRNETEEPQPGPSGLSNFNINRRAKSLKNENLASIFDEIHKEGKRKRINSEGSDSLKRSEKTNHHFKLKNYSRATTLRRSSLSSSNINFKTADRELISSRKGLKKEKNMTKGFESNLSQLNQPSTSRNSISNEACQSCGQKKRPIRESNRPKRRNVDSSSNAGSYGSSSKLLKSNTGERSEVSREENNFDDPLASTSSRELAILSQDPITKELLKEMIKTMKARLSLLRLASSSAGEYIISDNYREPRRALPSTDDDSDESESNEESEQAALQNIQSTDDVNSNSVQDATQVHSKKLLEFIVKSLTQIFGKNFGDLIQVLDEQIFNLHLLLHVALECTDFLLEQLNARSREINWGDRSQNEEEQGNERTDNQSTSISDNVSKRITERRRNLSAHSNDQPGVSTQNDNTESGITVNPFLSTHLRFVSPRSCSAALLRNSNRPFFLDYLGKRKRRMARSSPPRELFSPSSSRMSSISNAEGSFGMRRDTFSPDYLINNRTNRFRLNVRNSQERGNNPPSRIRSFHNESTSNNESNNSETGHHSTNNNNTLNNRRSGINVNSNNSNIYVYNNDSNNNSNNNNTTNNININNINISTLNNSYYDGNISIFSSNSHSNNDFFSQYFSNGNNSNNNGGNNNIIIFTGLSGDNEVNNSESNASTENAGSEENSLRSSGTNSSFINNNPAPPLRSMEVTLSRNENGDLSLRDERPIFWIRYGGSNESSGSSNSTEPRVSSFTVPVVQVNDIPVSDVSMLSQPRHQPQSPTPRIPEDVWRWRAWRPRLLHPRYNDPNPFEDQDSNINNYRVLRTSGGPHLGVYTLDPMIITDAPLSPHHRIQAWDFSKMNIPDISDREANGVVPECKIHNDASVDVSNDGHLLVTLLPSGRLSVTTMLGVYSLDWGSLGQLLYRTSFEQNAVSVSLSPTNRHLLVGLASRPVVVRDRTNMAQIFRLEGGKPSPNGGSWQSGRGRLVHIRDLEQTRESNVMSLNCIRWAPGAGQGLVYGTNTGQLKVLR